MTLLRDEAICIRHWDFSETSQTVSLFCRSHGLLRGLAKGAKRERSRFSGGIELLTRGQCLAIVKPGRDLAALTDWDLLEVFPALGRRLEAYYAGLYFAELIHLLLSEADPHPRLYDGLVPSLRLLDDAAARPTAILAFQWLILCEGGYRPVLDRDAETGADLAESGTLAFGPAVGGTVNDTGHPDRWRVRPETIALLRSVPDDACTNRNWLASTPGDGSQQREQEQEQQQEVVHRANRLLAAYLRAIVDREPTTMRYVFGPLKI